LLKDDICPKPKPQQLQCIELLLAQPNFTPKLRHLSAAVENGDAEAARLLAPRTPKDPIVTDSGKTVPWYTLMISHLFGHPNWQELIKAIGGEAFDWNVIIDNEFARTVLHDRAEWFPFRFTLEKSMQKPNSGLIPEERLRPEAAQQQRLAYFTQEIEKHLERLRFLLTHKANPKLQTTGGKTALHLFLGEVDIRFVPGATVKVIELFRTHGQDFTLVDEKGNTVLHAAAEKGNDEAVSHLLSLGLEMDVRNNEGTYATMKGIRLSILQPPAILEAQAIVSQAPSSASQSAPAPATL
jgi:hypothetical protein